MDREKELVFDYRTAKEVYTEASKAEKEAKARILSIEEELITLMIDKSIERTAKYEGIGFVTLNKPKVRASCSEDNKYELFEYLKEIEREDMIKTSVHPGTLSTFIKEILAEGKEPPKFVNYYLQNNLTLTKK